MIRAAVWLVALAGLVTPASADLWEDRTASTIGTTAGWSNKVEIADLDGAFGPDILFANGGNYSAPGTPEQNRVFLNQGPGAMFLEATDAVFGPTGDLARVIKVRDVDGDGDPDIFVGATYQTQSRLYLGDGDGSYTEVTATNLPQAVASVGDLELGDVDGDGDLDVLLADWGPGNPSSNTGGRTRLWLNDGAGGFTDATAERMPDVLVRWSWDVELADVDNDFDLDALISCKSCSGSYLFRNDGQGWFTEIAGALPQFGNNYELEAMDVDGDGFLDLVTVNDGPQGRQHIFRNDGQGGFTDATATLWPSAENPAFDDNVVAFLDADSDGDADFLIGSLDGDDRLLRYGGTGFTSEVVMVDAPTPGTLGLAVADLDGDDRLDVVQAQGEVASPDKLFMGVDLPVDSAAPVIGPLSLPTGLWQGEPLLIRARVHDRKTPNMPHDWQVVDVRWEMNGGPTMQTSMSWYGEHMWRAALDGVSAGTVTLRACAIDRAGNETCSAVQSIEVTLDAHDDVVTTPPGGGGGGCCDTGGGGPGAATVLAGLVLLSVRRRRRRRCARARTC
jgi:MYXO-CTERM domain-containing protein